MGLNRKST